MHTIDTLRAEPVLTADRVIAAWVAAGPGIRGALLCACCARTAVGITMPSPPAVRLAAAVTGLLLALAALVDLREHKLPNRLLAVAFLVTAAGALSALDGGLVVSALLGMVLAGGLLLLVRLGRGVGMGDVKMAAVVGASTGSVALVAAPVAIAVAAASAGVFGLLAGRTRLPLGPALWAGWAVALAGCAAGWPA